MYAPIFREKLKKLERRGQGRGAEAVRLRRTLALVDRAQTGLRHGQEDSTLTAAE
jgi:hypothetical protein|tara:strand:- start:983 stop:1147 length:165 start_codon:yes stop_codon:yes gene_type:complete